MNEQQITMIARKLDGESRELFLASTCGDDADKRNRIENMLGLSTSDPDEELEYDSASPTKAKSDNEEKPQVSILTDSPLNAIRRICRATIKHSGKIAVATFVLMLLAGGVVGTTWMVKKSAQQIEAANQAREEATTLSKRMQQTMSSITSAFESAPPEVRANNVATAKSVLIAARDNLDAFELDDEGKVELLTSLIDSLKSIDQYQAARETGEVQVEFCKSKFGEKSLNTIAAMNRLVQCLELTGQRIEAWDLQSAVMDGSRDSIGQGHPEYIRGLTQQGIHLAQSNVYARENNPEVESQFYKRAKGHLASAIPGLKKLYGEHDEEVIKVMQMFASSATAAKDFGQALELRKELFRLQTEKRGIEDSATSDALRRLMIAYLDFDQDEVAIQLVQGELKSCVSKLGETHPRVMSIKDSLALGYERTEQHDLAFKLRTQIDEETVKELGETHPASVFSGCMLAELCREIGRTSQAEQILGTRLDVSEEELAASSYADQLNVDIVANRLRDMGKTDESIQLLEQMLAFRSKHQGSERLRTLNTTTYLAMSYHRNGRVLEALELAVGAHERFRLQLGGNNPAVNRIGYEACVIMGTAMDEVDQLIGEGDFQYAERYLKIMQQYHGPYANHKQRETQKNYVDVLIGQGKFVAASKNVERWQQLIDLQDQWAEKVKQENRKRDQQQFSDELPVTPEEKASLLAAKSICQLELDDVDAAEAAVKQALKTRTISSFDRNRCDSVSAVCLAHDGKFEEAEKKATSAFKSAESQLEITPRSMTISMPYACQCLIKVYELSGKDEEVKKWKTKLDDLQQQIRSRRLIEI